MLASDAASAAATWRPQLFGSRRPTSIADPIIEPLWTGPRVLAFVDRGTATLTDADGEVLTAHEAVTTALVAAARDATMLLEGFLTPEPIQSAEVVAAREPVSLPKPSDALSQMVIGKRPDRKDRLFDHMDEARRRTTDAPAQQVALVVVDLLWLDDESLCDVPLLERKRVLESAIDQSELIRVGIHVRPPVDTWLGSWRLLGLKRIAFKAANSRYLPGRRNDDWAISDIPRL